MSEFDSLSDSDWLDVTSNRDSDADSAFSHDSDQDEIGQRLSRRSSTSLASSTGGQIDAWEGFVDNGGYEDLPDNESQSVLATVITSSSDSGTNIDPSIQHNPAEDVLVKEALDQSLISTLSSSRSNTCSTHNSVRDLRLSFPDPLASSRDELQKVFDNVTQTNTIITSTGIRTDQIEAAAAANSIPLQPLQSSDAAGSCDTSSQLLRHGLQPIQTEKAEFDVILYGSSSLDKWNFPKTLVERMISGTGRTVIGSTICAEKRAMYLNLERQCDSSSEVVVVHDRTDDATRNEIPGIQESRRPTLAILYLPSSIHPLPEHTLYLPVFLPSASCNLGRAAAESDWKSLSLPPNKLAHLSKDIGAVLFDDEFEEVTYLRARRLFERLVSEGKRRSTRSLSEHLRPAHAVTIFAFVSLVVGLAMNTGFRRTCSLTTAAIPSTSLWGIFGPEINRSSTLPAATTTKVNEPVMTGLAKDFSVALYDPGCTSVTLVPEHKQSINGGSVAVVHPLAVSGEVLKDRVGDIVVRQTMQLATVKTKPPTQPSFHPTAGPSKIKSGSSFGSVVNTISDALDFNVKLLRQDIDELAESLDELSRAIHRQTKARVHQSKGKAKQIHENVRHRHNRARGKAKELRKRGGVILSFAGEQIIGRTEFAKRKARDFSNSLVASEAWQLYQARQVELAFMLKGLSSRAQKKGYKCGPKQSQTKTGKNARQG